MKQKRKIYHKLQEKFRSRFYR